MVAIAERIRPLREHLGLGRHEFAEKVGTKKQTLIDVEMGRQRANEFLIEGICTAFPGYAYWLVTGNEIPEAGQISPETEKRLQELGEQRRGCA